MSLLDKLPGMTEEALGVLGGNAERLARSGTARQKTDAAALLPAIRAEMSARRQRNLTETPRGTTGGRRPRSARVAGDP